MTVRESSTSYNARENTVSTRKPTLMDQRAQDGKQALQQYLQASPEEGALLEEASIYTAEMIAIRG